MRPVSSALLSAIPFALLLASVGAQDFARDLPPYRVVPRPAPTACVEQGLARLAAGWDWEAARMFRELVQHEPGRPFGHLGLALAMRSAPNSAARLCWQAIARVEAGTPEERRIVAAYRDYFGIAEQPEIVDPRFRDPPGRERTTALLAALEGVDGELAPRLLAIERARASAAVVAAEPRRVLQLHNAYLQQTGALPCLVPGYRQLLEQAGMVDGERLLDRLPRHPRLGVGDGRCAGPLPGLVGTGTASWQPRMAPGFDLPRGLGGRGRYADHAGRPLLVVFFLGFG
ncbi:MAG: hypothetical protein KDC98_26415 [Planctomycetes bacterium]|nr:hypothetical protein [Planctomycetota bacterium]